jgi:hypothetical protein
MVADETRRARARGVPVEGICLYPIANHLGWDDDRLCENGLLGHWPVGGTRAVDAPLLEVIRDAFPPGDRVRDPAEVADAFAAEARARR